MFYQWGSQHFPNLFFKHDLQNSSDLISQLGPKMANVSIWVQLSFFDNFVYFLKCLQIVFKVNTECHSAVTIVECHKVEYWGVQL